MDQEKDKCGCDKKKDNCEEKDCDKNAQNSPACGCPHKCGCQKPEEKEEEGE